MYHLPLYSKHYNMQKKGLKEVLASIAAYFCEKFLQVVYLYWSKSTILRIELRKSKNRIGVYIN